MPSEASQNKETIAFFKIECQITELLNQQKSIHSVPSVLKTLPDTI